MECWDQPAWVNERRQSWLRRKNPTVCTDFLSALLPGLDGKNSKTHIAVGASRYGAPTSKLNCSFDLEDPMNDRMFDSPVFVKRGTNLVQEIACLEDALEFLYDWPKERRGVIYQTALRACQRAFDTGYPISSAREAFCGFARSAKVHEDNIMPWTTPGHRRQGGGLVA